MYVYLRISALTISKSMNIKYLLFVLLLGFSCKSNQTQSLSSKDLKEGNLTLQPCEIKTDEGKYPADCGEIAVRENCTVENSRLISLPITRIRSLSDNPDKPIFYLAGGPGQSNMKFKPPHDLLLNHDFVMVGYRGVDGSVKLDCPEVEMAILGDGNGLLSESSIKNLGDAFNECALRLQAEGIDLDSYTMIDVIRDMESARVALGYDKINLLSQSYGTRVAQIYAYKHPASLHRSVMISVNPPGRFVWEPSTIDKQIEYYNNLYLRDSVSKKRAQDLAQMFRNVLNNLPPKWLLIPIDSDRVKIISFALLYHRKTAAVVFDAYASAEGGDYSGLALMSLAYNLIIPGMNTWGDMAAKAISADFDSTRNYAVEMNPDGSVIGSPFSELLWSSAKWPTRPIPEEYRKVQKSVVPTLMVSGSIDFSTPAEYATDQLLPYLENGRQVIVAEMGHTQDLWNVQRLAMLRLITSFFDTGIADDSLFTYEPMDFKVNIGLPMIAKITVGVVILIIFALLFLLRFIVIKIRRKLLSNRNTAR